MKLCPKAAPAPATAHHQQALPDVNMAAPMTSKQNKFAFACAILASMTSILLGYAIGVMSGAIIYIKKGLNFTDVQIEILALMEILPGITNVYSLIGSFIAGRISDRIGRRYTIFLAGAIFFTGALLMGFATNYAFFIAGRFAAGIGVGFALIIVPVYTAEVSSASTRGFLTWLRAGNLLGHISNYAFSKLPLYPGWRMMLGIGAVPSVFLALGVLAMPESPRWLVMQGRLGDAEKVLEQISDSKEAADNRLSELKSAAGIPETSTGDLC